MWQKGKIKMTNHIRLEIWIEEDKEHKGILSEDMLHVIGNELIGSVLKIAVGEHAKIIDSDWERFED